MKGCWCSWGLAAARAEAKDQPGLAVLCQQCCANCSRGACHPLGPSDPWGVAKTANRMPTGSSSSSGLSRCTWLGLTSRAVYPASPKEA